MATSLFEQADLIHSYSRAEALADGVLVDVSEMAQEAGFKVPVAITSAVWADVNDIPKSKQGIQDVEGRLWDILWVASVLARQADGDQLNFRIHMDLGRKKNYYLRSVIGPGDHAEPVITIMRQDED